MTINELESMSAPDILGKFKFSNEFIEEFKKECDAAPIKQYGLQSAVALQQQYNALQQANIAGQMQQIQTLQQAGLLGTQWNAASGTFVQATQQSLNQSMASILKSIYQGYYTYGWAYGHTSLLIKKIKQLSEFERLILGIDD